MSEGPPSGPCGGFWSVKIDHDLRESLTSYIGMPRPVPMLPAFIQWQILASFQMDMRLLHDVAATSLSERRFRLQTGPNHDATTAGAHARFALALNQAGGAEMPSLESLFNAFVTILVTIDPPGLAPLFLALTRGMNREERL